MVKDYNGKEITPGLYESANPDSELLYHVFEEGGILKADSPNSWRLPLKDITVKLIRVDPKRLVSLAEMRIKWIQDHFPETMQNPSNPQPSQAPNLDEDDSSCHPPLISSD